MPPQLTLIAPHRNSLPKPRGIDWAQIAKTPGTKVLRSIRIAIAPDCESPLADGLSPATPVALGALGAPAGNCRPQVLFATIAAVADEAKIGLPAVAVFGDVVMLRDKLNWFEQRPLFGQRVAVTRAPGAGGAARPPVLQERGAEVLEIPTIKIQPPTRLQEIWWTSCSSLTPTIGWYSRAQTE